MTASFSEFQKIRRSGEDAVREAVFGWVMGDAPGELTLAAARSLAKAITVRWNQEAGEMYDAIVAADRLTPDTGELTDG